MSLGAIYGSRGDIRTVNRVEYKVMTGPSNTESKVAVTLNKHILLGIFPTSAMAIEAVEGVLVKVGSDNPKQRRIKLTVDKDAVFTGADFIPATGSTNWTTSISTVKSTTTYPRAFNSSAMSGCTVPLLVRVEITGAQEVWTKITTTSTDTAGTPASTGYTKIENNTLIYIPMTRFLQFKVDSPLVSITSQTSISGSIKIYNAYTEDLLDTVTTLVRWV